MKDTAREEGDMAPAARQTGIGTTAAPRRGSKSTPRTTKTERLSINITETTADALKELSARKGTSVTEVVRRAVAVLKLLEDQQMKGAEIQLYTPGSETVRTLTIV